ncbi:hypothetical protein ABEB36_013204 [Hypothenemus hampei]|uniref:Uncharacterized protein n=1 Tax=Hypothenemus hampei TaxID=57062 RepID=A0ABD1EBM8_HYPHA
MPQTLLFCAVFLIFYGILDGAKIAERPLVIFQPGEFFDPFTETINDAAESQHKAHIVPKPNLIVGPPVVPVQRQQHNRGTYRPRTIAQVSGNAKELKAQLWQPSSFLRDFDKVSKLATQHAAASQVRQRRPVNLIRKHHSQFPYAEGLTPVKSRQHSKLQESKPLIKHPVVLQEPKPSIRQSLKVLQEPKTLAYVNNPVQLLPQLPVALKQIYTPPIVATPQLIKPSAPLGDSAHIFEQAQKLLAQSSALYGQPITPPDSNLAGSDHSHHHHSETNHHKDKGQKQDSGYHKSFGDKKENDYKKSEHHSKGDHEKHEDHEHKAHNEEHGNNHHHHHDEGAHYKKHHEGKKSHNAAKFGEKKGHKRGHKTKGYHNKFHRDEYHREHKFYDDYHKEGFHEKHGSGHSQYKNKEGAFKKGNRGKSGASGQKHGKKGFSKKGHVDEAHEGYSKKHSHHKHHKHHKDYHGKGGGSRGKQYGYSSKE